MISQWLLSRPTWLKGLIITAAFMWAMVFVDWNEHRSPWGRDIQTWKADQLKKQLCN